MTLSNSQITKLGDRLRQDKISKEDLALLDIFRQTFSALDEQVYPRIEMSLDSKTKHFLTKRKRKTQQSIVDKLKRQRNLRLPQMQDIAGCRIVVEGGSKAVQHINDQLSQVFELQSWQYESKNRHSDGYRAIHIIIKAEKKFYEIQLRTYAQDVWANLIEALCDKTNSLKYGGTEQEQKLMCRLKVLAENFHQIDQQAHTMNFICYQQQIEEAIKNVLSH